MCPLRGLISFFLSRLFLIRSSSSFSLLFSVEAEVKTDVALLPLLLVKLELLFLSLEDFPSILLDLEFILGTDIGGSWTDGNERFKKFLVFYFLSSSGSIFSTKGGLYFGYDYFPVVKYWFSYFLSLYYSKSCLILLWTFEYSFPRDSSISLPRINFSLEEDTCDDYFFFFLITFGSAIESN